MQYSVAVRNAGLDAREVAIGASAVLKVFSGTIPTSCAAADTADGDVLATLNLPEDWMAAASNGIKVKSGTWQDLSADETGEATHFRIYSALGACGIQGTVGVSASDMITDSVQFTAGQSFTVVTFTIQDNNG